MRRVPGTRKNPTADGERVIRLVVRRCRLNLIEIHPDRGVVHHWCCQGPGDLRPIFKKRGGENIEWQICLDRQADLMRADDRAIVVGFPEDPKP